MTTPSRSCHPEGCTVELPRGFNERVLCLERYLVEANENLAKITNRVHLGELVDHETRDWMLAQVDLVVETIGDESLQLSEELRSKLLELLLSVANLNEHIRRQASLNLQGE